ncbi:hypothetical protein MMC18_001756 [Xylographa bjoerkii]|nr:hypothetical protein [Xylographa bjoerkii]
MAKVVDQLYKVLGIQDGQIEIQDHDTGTWQKRLDRVRFSFSTKRIKKLDELTVHNHELERLLRHSDKFMTMRTARNPSAYTRFFATIRDKACNLYAALRGGFKYDCTGAHRVKLRLDNLVAEQQSDFNIVFEGSSTIGFTQTRQEVLFELVERPEDEHMIAHSSKSSDFSVGVADAKLLYTPALRDQRQPTSRSVDDTASSFGTTPTSLPSVKNTSNDPGRVKGSNMISNLLHKTKRQKTARFAPDNTSTQVSSTASNTTSVVDDMNIPVRIDDLCSAICLGKASNSSTYYLFGELQPQYKLHRLSSRASPSAGNAMNLDMLLTGSHGLKLNRRQRVVIAGTVAYSLLQFQKTPWDPSGWRKNDIWFYCDETDILEKPYILESFKPSNQTLVPNATDARHAQQDPFDTPLIRFGILHLELCFGETIEARSVHKRYVKAEGQGPNLTNYATALEWRNEVMDDFPDFLGPIDCCLKNSFGEQADWKNERFLDNMYTNLVKPLGDALTNFTRK